MKLYFKTYCNTHNLKQVRDFVREGLTQNGITDADVYMMVLAVDEICSNLIIHSNNCDDEKQIDLVLQFADDKLHITIRDYGVSFNYADRIDNSVEKLVEEKRKGGLGLLLVKKIMDEVRYETSSGQNCWVLCKSLKPV